MKLPFQTLDDELDITAASKLQGMVAGVYSADGESFETAGRDRLELDFQGIAGDLHRGYERQSGAREPWYRRDTTIRNDRQISMVSPVELAIVARSMEIEEIRPQWIGANLLIEGVPRLSMLPPGTLMMFAGGACIRIAGYNAPCRISGTMVAKRARMTDQQAGALAFPKAAKRLRGLVGWVEKPGVIEQGEAVSVRIPEQWIYPR